MPGFLLLLLRALLTLGPASATLSALPGRPRPHCTAYRHRAAARKRWRRMGVLGRRRYKRRYQKAHPRRGVIRVARAHQHAPAPGQPSGQALIISHKYLYIN